MKVPNSIGKLFIAKDASFLGKQAKAYKKYVQLSIGKKWEIIVGFVFLVDVNIIYHFREPVLFIHYRKAKFRI